MTFLNYKHIALLTVFFFFLFTGCEDYNQVEVENKSNNEVDFTTFVLVGNSLTAGYQSNALYESAQEYSFPNLLARQFHVADNFEQPLISEPGLGERIQLDDNLEPTSTGDGSGSNQNANLDRPYNNLGIPGAVLADFTGEAGYEDRKSNNPIYDVILRDFGDTQAEQLTSMDPTFVSFWLGNNDVLGYVTSGGHTPYTPTGDQGFDGLYQASMDVISSTEANAILYNIPNVTSIPFVFIVNQTLRQNGTITVTEEDGENYFALVTPSGGEATLWIETTDPQNPGEIQDTVRMKAPNSETGNPGSFFLLSEQTALADSLEKGVGWLKQSQDDENPPPLPSRMVLDDGEATQAISLVNDYNDTIESLAANNDFALVDVNSIFSEIIENGGVSSDGVELAPVPGELFSFDGVHPSNRGHAIVTNATIEVINDFYGTNLEPVDISEIPVGFPVGAN